MVRPSAFAIFLISSYTSIGTRTDFHLVISTGFSKILCLYKRGYRISCRDATKKGPRIAYGAQFSKGGVYILLFKKLSGNRIIYFVARSVIDNKELTGLRPHEGHISDHFYNSGFTQNR